MKVAMSRIFRLHQLLQAFREEASQVTAERLAVVLGVSIRTVHRDIATLRALGASIDGAAGFGFTLVDDVSVPPLTFSEDELEAIVFGLRKVEEFGDRSLSEAASSAFAKLRSRLPKAQSHRLRHAVMGAKQFNPGPNISVDIAALRDATWKEVEVRFHYHDARGAFSQRQVRPLSIAYLEQNLCLIGWCLLRQDTRVFRLDRMSDLEITTESFRPHRVVLMERALAQILSDSPKHNQ